MRISRRQQSIKGELRKIDCQLTAIEGGIIIILQSLLGTR